MVSGKKVFIFGILGLALGYFCHRLVLLYDSLPNQPPLERLAYLLGEGQNQVLNPLWNGHFTGRSVLGFCFGLVTKFTMSGLRCFRGHVPAVSRSWRNCGYGCPLVS